MRYVFVWIQSNAERRKLIEKLITNAKKKSIEIFEKKTNHVLSWCI